MGRCPGNGFSDLTFNIPNTTNIYVFVLFIGVEKKCPEFEEPQDLRSNPFQGGGVATYPSAEGRRGTHGCVFQGRKAHGVPTNVYSRKTSEKPKRCGLRTLIVKGSGVVSTHGEGISTPPVRHNRR